MTKSKKPIMIVAGTRPEAIKLAPVIWSLDKKGIDYVFVWSGQHYDYEMSKVFFEQLELPNPDLDLNVRSGSHAEQTSRIMIGIEKVIEKFEPSIVVAQGDTNTTLASAIASVKKHVPFAHVEAGLRSWDRTMPEEINRIIADAIAELHFAPTRLAAINLMHEGIPLWKIHITGNTIADVVYRYLEYAAKEGEKIITEYALESNKYILVTVHRQENTDNPEKLRNIVKALVNLSKHYPVVLPLHPRTRNRLYTYGLWKTLASQKNVHILKPLDYFQFLGLLMKSLVILTDSGGVQEEAYILKIPTLTLRYNTERPETVLIGINKIIGVNYTDIINETLKIIEYREKVLKTIEDTPNLLGDGTAGSKIANILESSMEKGLEISPFDGRVSYPFYTLKLDIDEYELKYVIGMYDSHGNSTIDPNRARWFVVTRYHPYAAIYKEIYRD